MILLLGPQTASFPFLICSMHPQTCLGSLSEVQQIPQMLMAKHSFALRIYICRQEIIPHVKGEGIAIFTQSELSP